MLQILGLREYYDTKTGKNKIAHKFFDRGWQAPSVTELFENLDHYLKKIPNDEKYNMFFTVCNCHGDRARDFSFQTILPIDIDKIDPGTEQQVIDLVCTTLELAPTKTGTAKSGNGVHLYIQLEDSIKSIEEFKEKKVYYTAICRKINIALDEANLKGEADPVVFSANRLMRLPGTKNIKKDKGEKFCELLQRHIEPQNFSMEKASGIPMVHPEDQIHKKAMDLYSTPDTKTILEECKFLAYAKDAQKDLTEPQWYAVLSILPRLEDGTQLAHDYSRHHVSYNPVETDEKIDQAIQASGPRTCTNIGSLWDGCKECKHFNKLKTPILIEGKEHIRTKKTGFYDVRVNTKGDVTRKPNYKDMLNFYKKKHPFVVMDNSEVVYRYKKNFWKEEPPTRIKNFAENNFDPAPNMNMRNEFVGKIRANNLRDADWFLDSVERKLNFKNGVYDIETDTISKHSSDLGFRSILPYEYDPLAECPRFDKFLKEVTQDRQDLEDVLLEFAGFAISGDPCWIHKALFLSGEGANGKSTYMDVLKAMVGKGYYSALSLTDLNNDAKRYMVEGKLFNIGEENHITSLSRSEVFKTMVGGGEIVVKRLYSQPYTYLNRTKLIFACNALPVSGDKSYGFFRRMMIVPFDAKFTDEKKNKENGLTDRLIGELPGIFNRVLDAYHRLHKQGGFTKSTTIEAALVEYKKETDNYETWKEERIVMTNALSDKNNFDYYYQDYRTFCDARDEKFRLSFQAFKKCMGSEYTIHKDEGSKVKMVLGIKLNTNY